MEAQIDKVTPTQKPNLIHRLSKKQKISLLVLSFFVVILPLVSAAALISIRLNSRAYLPATPPTPPYTPTPTTSVTPTPTVCTNKVIDIKFSGTCELSSTKIKTIQPLKGYKSAIVVCENGYKETLKTPKCFSSQEFSKFATTACQKHSVCNSDYTPTITTQEIPNGKVGQNYSAKITATISDKTPLAMTITNLPPGIKQGKCLNAANSNTTSCHIQGIPAKAGSYSIEVKVSSKWSGSTTKVLPLKILPSRPIPTRK